MNILSIQPLLLGYILREMSKNPPAFRQSQEMPSATHFYSELYPTVSSQFLSAGSHGNSWLGAGEASLAAKDRAHLWQWTCCSLFSADVPPAVNQDSRHKRNSKANAVKYNKYELLQSPFQQSVQLSVSLCLKGKVIGGNRLLRKTLIKEIHFHLPNAKTRLLTFSN